MSHIVVSDLKELKNISNELKRLSSESKVLRLKKKEIEDRIIDYLHKEEQPGVKYGDIIVLSKEKTTRRKLKKKEKEEKAMCVLEEIGISNTKEALDSILESMKGEEIVSESIQLKETKL